MISELVLELVSELVSELIPKLIGDPDGCPLTEYVIGEVFQHPQDLQG